MVGANGRWYNYTDHSGCGGDWTKDLLLLLLLGIIGRRIIHPWRPGPQAGDSASLARPGSRCNVSQPEVPNDTEFVFCESEEVQ